MDSDNGAAPVVSDPSEHQMRLIREAIRMVACGGAPRVILAGISFDEPILDAAARLALEAGVRLVPLRRADEAGADIAIERVRA